MTKDIHIRPPSLTALRAFEAAVRHMSFTDAANELSVTPAALSFQIKGLESAVGTPLFIRRHRAIELTEAGKRLWPGIARGFTEIQSAWRLVKEQRREDRITITTGPAFTAKWLGPRLGKFVRANPDIEIRFCTTLALLDFVQDEIDLAVRFSEDGYSETYFSESLLEETSIAAVRPEIAQRIKQPRDLLSHPLIHDGSLDFLSSQPDWQQWFKTAGVRGKPKISLSFNQADHAVDAALQGSGVVLGRFSMLSTALRDGTLIAPFPIALRVKGQFRTACLKEQENRPAVAKFRNWLKEEVRSDIEFFPELQQ